VDVEIPLRRERVERDCREHAEGREIRAEHRVQKMNSIDVARVDPGAKEMALGLCANDGGQVLHVREPHPGRRI
jgi:hypothetical protein